MDNKIDWRSKLSSRKFWVAICGFVGGILMAFRLDEQTVTQVTGIIMAGASVLAYILGEAWTDAAGAQAGYSTVATSGYLEEVEEKPPEDDVMEDDLR